MTKQGKLTLFALLSFAITDAFIWWAYWMYSEWVKIHSTVGYAWFIPPIVFTGCALIILTCILAVMAIVAISENKNEKH